MFLLESCKIIFIECSILYWGQYENVFVADIGSRAVRVVARKTNPAGFDACGESVVVFKKSREDLKSLIRLHRTADYDSVWVLSTWLNSFKVRYSKHSTTNFLVFIRILSSLLELLSNFDILAFNPFPQFWVILSHHHLWTRSQISKYFVDLNNLLPELSFHFNLVAFGIFQSAIRRRQLFKAKAKYNYKFNLYCELRVINYAREYFCYSFNETVWFFNNIIRPNKS